MRFYRLIAAPALLLLLSGCYLSSDTRNEAEKRVDARSTCQAIGFIPPFNTEYENCILYEEAARVTE